MRFRDQCVERQNLTMPMGMRRFTRLTNAFSKKVENHAAAVSLHFAWYNLGRTHQTLTKKAGRPTTPAMAAGVETHPWSTLQIAACLTDLVVRRARFTRQVMIEMTVGLIFAGSILALALVDAIDTHHHRRPPTWDLWLLYPVSVAGVIVLLRMMQVRRRQGRR